jgi:hypothetical protein
MRNGGLECTRDGEGRAENAAGANMLLQTQVMRSPEARERIKICSASGIHVLSIPQYIVSGVITRESGAIKSISRVVVQRRGYRGEMGPHLRIAVLMRQCI